MKRFLVTCLLLAFTLPVLAENTILILGDSISSGYGINLNESWAKLLEKRLQQNKYNYRVINASIAGDTTSDGLARLPRILKQYHPKITIIELGGNDGLRGLQISQIKNNLTQIIALAKKSNSQIVVLGVRLPPNYGVLYNQKFQEIFFDLGKSHDIIVVPLFLNGIDNNSSLMQSDGIHPTETAQPKLLDNVWIALKKFLQ